MLTALIVDDEPLARTRLRRLLESQGVQVVELLFLGDLTYEVRLANKQLLRVGRSRYPELQRRMGLRHLP